MIGCDQLFYYPDRRDRGRPSDDGVAHEDVWFHAEDGVKLHGWFMPAAGAPRGAVLHVHGNAANITGHYQAVSWLPAEGYHVLTFDYRGYGRSEGRVTRVGTVRDTLAALDSLRARPEVRGRPVFVIGQSIGGAVAIAAAAERPGQVRGLVVDGAFSRYRDIAWHHVVRNPALLILGWWYPLMLSRAHDPIDCVKRISPTPVLFMHGTADRVVPHAMSKRLSDAAREPKELWLIEGMDHYEAWSERADEVHRRLLEFFAACSS